MLFAEPALPSSLISQAAHFYIMFCFKLLLISVDFEQLTKKNSIKSCLVKLSNYVDDSSQPGVFLPVAPKRDMNTKN